MDFSAPLFSAARRFFSAVPRAAHRMPCILSWGGDEIAAETIALSASVVTIRAERRGAPLPQGASISLPTLGIIEAPVRVREDVRGKTVSFEMAAPGATQRLAEFLRAA